MNELLRIGIKAILCLALYASPILYFPICAQETNNTEFRFGFKGGATFSQVNFDPKIGQKMTSGYQFGLLATYISEKNLGIWAELSYVQKGWTEEFKKDDAVLVGSYDKTIHYLEVPFMTMLKFGDGVVSFTMQGGLFGGLLLKEQQENEVGERGILGESPYFNRELDSKIDFGYTLGTSLLFNTGAGSFGIEARISNSLANFYEKTEIGIGENAQNQVIGGSIYYLFR